MNLYHNITAFSRNGEYLAYSSPDGCLKIWETSTNILKQEYTPSSHLSATCSSLSWGPYKQNTHVSNKSKKSKSNTQSVVRDLQLIAMGTMTGDILLYSFTNAELHTVLGNGHSKVVNDTSWYTATDTLFSCSSDQHIIGWDVCTGKIKTKWKADKVPIYSMCVIDEYNILSASSVILWWDLKQKAVIKTFSGHATEIFRLMPLEVGGKSSDNYFLSVATGDRVINVWQLSENNTKGSVASFVLSGEPGNIDVLWAKHEPFRMCAVTKDGLFHLFEHILNGRSKTPLHPKFTLQLPSKATDSCPKPQPIRILTANISDGLDSCLLAYGSFQKPVFERINVSDAHTDLFLIRDLSLTSSVSIENTVSKVKHTVKPNNVKMLAPSHMTDVTMPGSSSKKRKQKDTDVKELPMEERLKALDLSKIPKSLSDQEPPLKSDSMIHLLLQGLQSKDNNMLNTVLYCGDETVIQNTLQRLPIPSILLVLKEIHRRLNKQESRTHPCLKWLNGLLAAHFPYLMSCKDIDEYLGPISQLIEARVENFCKMSQLRGCLNILLSQVEARPSDSVDASSQPLFEYKSDSSDESDEESSEESNDDDEVEDGTAAEESMSSSSESEMEA